MSINESIVEDAALTWFGISRPANRRRSASPCGIAVAGEFRRRFGGKLGDISIYGQESNATTRRLAVMNLALRGIQVDFGPEHADTFRRDLHPDLRADYVLANPPFNDPDTAVRKARNHFHSRQINI